jgi:hypothetical protein
MMIKRLLERPVGRHRDRYDPATLMSITGDPIRTTRSASRSA